jgi:hypothetical protein
MDDPFALSYRPGLIGIQSVLQRTIRGVMPDVLAPFVKSNSGIIVHQTVKGRDALWIRSMLVVAFP